MIFFQVVPVAALENFVVDNFPQDPKPLPYLVHDKKFNFDINLEVDIKRKFFLVHFECVFQIFDLVSYFFSNQHQTDLQQLYVVQTTAIYIGQPCNKPLITQ